MVKVFFQPGLLQTDDFSILNVRACWNVLKVCVEGSYVAWDQSRARLKQDSRSRPFWCSRYPLGWQDSNWKYLVSFPFSIYSFVKSRSCLVFKKFTLAFITNLDILGQIVGNKFYFRFKQNLSFFKLQTCFCSYKSEIYGLAPRCTHFHRFIVQILSRFLIFLCLKSGINLLGSCLIPRKRS